MGGAFSEAGSRSIAFGVQPVSPESRNGKVDGRDKGEVMAMDAEADGNDDWAREWAEAVAEDLAE